VKPQCLIIHAPNSISQEDLHAFSSRAHGYVGADLSAVVREAGTIAINDGYQSRGPSESGADTQLELTLADPDGVHAAVRPSAMRSLFVETPPVRYSDIGGQASVIQKLREAVEWPLLHPEAFQRLGVKPPKGVLLYGPPGCSKTVLARACACESGVNFVAVKGPEVKFSHVHVRGALLTPNPNTSCLTSSLGNPSVQFREIFRKARAASPSIIFFVRTYPKAPLKMS